MNEHLVGVTIEKERAGALWLTCGCGLHIRSSAELMVRAWLAHLKVADPELYAVFTRGFDES